MNEQEKKALMEQMDVAAEVAREDLAKLVIKYPDAAGAFGSWMAAHYKTAGYKRLARQLVALGKE